MNRLTMPILVASSLAAFGCGEQQQAMPDRTAAADVRTEAVGPAARFIEQERDEFVREAQHELDQFGNQLAQIKSQAQTATGESKARLDAQTAELEGQWRAADARLRELKFVDAGQWRQAKTDFEQQLDDLKQSFDQSRAEGKQG